MDHIFAADGSYCTRCGISARLINSERRINYGQSYCEGKVDDKENGREHNFRIGLRSLLLLIGENPDREGLQETPDRVLRAMKEMLSGYGQDPKKLFKTFKDGKCDEMIVVSDIGFTSVCEHHMLPFTGVAHVGYLPNDEIIGLSKIPRLVDCFAKRLQVQERMTTQIGQAMMEGLQPKGCGVVTKAIHSCMSCRGVKKIAPMTCSSMLGVFKSDSATRSEFLSFVSGN
jgi:GTP cyclohydrolase I